MRIAVKWLLFLAAVLSPLAHAAEGDDYPRRPVKLIVPNAAGSSNDTLSRILAQQLSQELGQNVIVENDAGAAGLVGMEMGKNAAPDGYTLIAGSPSATTIAANLRKSLPYDPLADFEYISLYAVLPSLLVVNPSLPVKTMPELLDYLRSAKGDVFMASAGPGSQSHLAGAMLQQMGKFPSVHVPYKGGGPQVLAVMSGEAQWTITPAASVLGHTRSGKLRAIAESLPQRTPLMPDVPAVAETVPGYSYSAWNGLLAPKGTPPAVTAKIRAALAKAITNPQLKEGFGRQGAEPLVNTPDEFRKMVQAEMESTAALVKAIDLKIDR